MYTAIYRLQSTDMQHDVAHLFEHIVINGLFDFLDINGFDPGIAGWIVGDTFPECIYLDIGVYDPIALQLCSTFIQNLPQFSDEQIEHNRKIIECEERAHVHITDMAELRLQLGHLQKRAWSDGRPDNAITITKPKELIKLSKHAAAFRDITFILFHDNFTLEEAKVFQRLSIILNDTLHRSLYRSKVCYYRESGDVVKYQEGGFTFSMTLTVPRGQATVSQYTDFAIAALGKLGSHASYPAIHTHFVGFATSPYHTSMVVDYYRTSGVVTSTEELLELATPERIHTIIEKLYIDCHATSPDDPGYKK